MHFLSANLFSADIHAVHEQIGVPVWMSHGVRGDFTAYRGKVIVETRPNWQFTVVPPGALPCFELPRDFCETCDRFLAIPLGGVSVDQTMHAQEQVGFAAIERLRDRPP